MSVEVEFSERVSIERFVTAMQRAMSNCFRRGKKFDYKPWTTTKLTEKLGEELVVKLGPTPMTTILGIALPDLPDTDTLIREIEQLGVRREKTEREAEHVAALQELQRRHEEALCEREAALQRQHREDLERAVQIERERKRSKLVGTKEATPYALYRWYDADGNLLYIGKTNNIARRTAQHAAVQPWWDSVVRCEVERMATQAQRADPQLHQVRIMTDYRYRVWRGPGEGDWRWEVQIAAAVEINNFGRTLAPMKQGIGHASAYEAKKAAVKWIRNQNESERRSDEAQARRQAAPWESA